MGSRTRNRYRYNLSVWQRVSRRIGIHIRIPISWSCKLYCNHSFIIRTSFTEIYEFSKRLTKKRIYITHTIHKLSHIILYISHALYVSLSVNELTCRDVRTQTASRRLRRCPDSPRLYLPVASMCAPAKCCSTRGGENSC